MKGGNVWSSWEVTLYSCLRVGLLEKLWDQAMVKRIASFLDEAFDLL